MFFTCVTRHYPFGSPEKQANFRRLVDTGSYEEDIVPERYPHLRGLIRSCLTVDPKQRPTAAALLENPFFSA
jgi:serine/threonine protein kinase